MSRGVTWTLRHPWAVVGAVAVAVAAWWAIGSRSQQHHVTASFAAATLVVPGLDVKVDGVTAGKVGKVRYSDGRAVVDLGIDDSRYWPLHQGSRAIIRFGTTIGNGTRYVELIPGPESAPPIAEGGLIPERETQAPVEFDQIFNTFGRRTRADVRQLMSRAQSATAGRAAGISSSLHQAPPAVRAAGDVLSDLATDGQALDALVVNGQRMSRTLAVRAPVVRDLVTVAARTFGRFSANARALGGVIDGMPDALSQTRTTLERLDTSVDGRLTPLVEALRPGAAQLDPLASAAGTAIGRLRSTLPSALAAVRDLKSAAPGLTTLFERATPLVSDAGRATADVAPMMACIRPYAPEAGGVAHGWGSWTKNYTTAKHPDVNKAGPFSAHYARVQALAGPESVHDYPTGMKTSELLSLVPGIVYAFPMPPGFLAGKPILNAKCGYGPDSLDPAKDPEQQGR